MKELSIEQKAKAYDKALRVIKNLIDAGLVYEDAAIQIFPELCESEDEKTRKRIIALVNAHGQGMYKDEMLAWLEKQSKETSWKPSKEEMDVLYGLAYITNQYDEHKEEVITRLYQDLKREFFNGASYENMFHNTEDGVRRSSTIQVLEYVRSLDTYNQFGKADIDKNIAWLEKQNSNVDNANKEYWRGYREGKQEILDKYAELEKQGEQKLPIEKLPSEMKTIGESLGFTTQEECDEYNQIVSDCIMSDTDKSEQKPSAWGKEDDIMLRDILGWLPAKSRPEYNQIRVEWLKSLKDRVQPEQEWNEEDEKMLNSFLHKVEVCNLLTNKENVWIVKKLKSLKHQPHWKPSDEQITVLELASKYERVFTPKQIDILIGLKEQLKKLTE